MRYAIRAAALGAVVLFTGCPAPQREDSERAAASSGPGSGTPPGPEASASSLAAAEGFARVELPGLSIEGPGRPSITGDYGAGAAQVTTPFEWAVTWQRGDLPPLEALRSIANAMLGAFQTSTTSPGRIAGTRPVEVAGKSGHEFELVNGIGNTLVATFTECGGRTIQILVGGRAEARANSDKLVASFRCTPDPQKDLDRVGVAVEVRPGWKRTKPSGPPMLVNEREIVVNPTTVAAPNPRTPIEDFVPGAVRAAGFTLESERPIEKKGRKLWRASLSMNGKTHPAAILAWRCEDGRVGAVYVFGEPGSSLDEGIELALTARCLAPDEAPPTYPVKGL